MLLFLSHMAILIILLLQATVTVVAQPPIYYSPVLYRLGYYGDGYRNWQRGGEPVHNMETDYYSQSSSEESSEESHPDSDIQSRQGTHDIQFRRSGHLKYFILDRKCTTYGVEGRTLRTFPMRYSATKSSPLRTKDSGKLRDCWVELNMKNKSENVEKGLWVEGGEIKVIVHGYTPLYWNLGEDIIDDQGIFEMGEEYKNDTNVFVMDWTLLGASLSYISAAFNTRLAGKSLADFLVTIQQRNNFSEAEYWGKLHLIGFSLGAHVSGVAGHLIQKENKVKVNRVTGLDPAGPEFDGLLGIWPKDRQYSLDRKDASFVDVIHCNMGNPWGMVSAAATGTYGTSLERGTVDFFPNGGVRQSPFCSSFEDFVGCSHMMCPQFFKNSIRQQDYLACICGDWDEYLDGHCPCKKNGKSGTLMGEHVSHTAKGRYYLSISA